MRQIISNINKKMLRLAFFSDLHAARFTLALAEFIWFVALLLPGDSLNRPTYRVMHTVLPIEFVWALIWLLSASIQFYIVISGNYHSRFAVLFAAFNSILWWFVTISMYLSISPVPAGISGEAALSVVAAWVFIRSGWIPAGMCGSDTYKENRCHQICK